MKLRAKEFLCDSLESTYLKAIKDFGVRPDEKLARAVAHRNYLATAKFLTLARRRWARLLIAAGRTHGPIPTSTRPLAAPRNTAEAAARYTASGAVAKLVQTP